MAPLDKTHGIFFDAPGGPDVLKWREIPLPPPGPGAAQIIHRAIGVNFIDTYHRAGAYPLPLPSGLGLEAAGYVSKVGAGVKEFKAGDRVAYTAGPVGAYAEAANVPESHLISLPEDISEEHAAAIMLKGLTAHFLIHQTFPLTDAHTVLLHAAAGGVGLLACQWAHHLGARVFGTVGSPDKAKLATAHGCAAAILYNEVDFVSEIKRLTSGAGVDVVYDSVGAATFMKSLDCLKKRGLLVSFGNASGPPPKLDLGLLATKGSLYVTRPTLFNHIDHPHALRQAAAALFDFIRQKNVKINIGQTYALKDAAQAHRDLETRKTSGSTLLIP